jgi:Glycosyl transferase family 2
MKLAMTVLARDEADVIDAQIAFHLHAGVDFVIATDNRSRDGTTNILERYERAGVLHLLREDGDDMRQDEWVTRMARMAATDFGAEWVVNADADEFWWPRGGSLREVLSAVPKRYGVVRGCWRHFLPRPHDGAFFAERMTVRLAEPAFPGDKRTIFHAHQKVAHRGAPDVTIEAGNHNAAGAGLEPVRAWHPVEVLHFSFRSPAQIATKARGGWVRNAGYEPTDHQLGLDAALREGRIDAFYDSFAVTDEALEHGLADGKLALDTRLRDALRSIREPDGGFRLPSADEAPILSFPFPGVDENAAYAAEAAVLVDIDGIVRAEGRVDRLEERLASLERGPLARVRSRLT